MKNSIKLTALFLLASTGLFAATSAKAAAKVSTDAITITSMASQTGVTVGNGSADKAIVMIYDVDGNVIRKDVLSAAKGAEKAYILNKLDNGNYSIEITSKGETVKKAIHVYDEDQTKMFIIKG